MHYPEFILLVLYIFAGVGWWTLYYQGLAVGRRKMQLINKPLHPIKVSPPPSVSILIPAKDEGERIRRCLESAVSQDYPDVEVIAIDDRSTDCTGRVMDEVAASHPTLKVLHITKPPESGWTGKNNALHQGSKLANGQWMLFVDSDMVLEKDAVTATLSVVLRKQFDMLSLLPRVENHSFWERTLIPLCGGAASTMYMIALSNKAGSNSSFANGQFMLMSRHAYDTIGGHEGVRGFLCEDVAIARNIKRAGLRPRVSWGTDYCSVRMYDTLPAIIRGWGRIYYAARFGTPWAILAALVFVFACMFSTYPAIAWGIWRTLHPVPATGFLGGWWHKLLGPEWLALGIAHWSLMTLCIARIYRWSGTPGRSALLFPIVGPVFAWTLIHALKLCITKKIEWRGTAYSPTNHSPTVVATPVPAIPPRVAESRV